MIIADAKRWTPHYTQKLAAQLNGTYAHKDLLIMEDHPKTGGKSERRKIESRQVHFIVGAT